MMKNLLMSIFCVSLLSACGSGLVAPLDSGDRMPEKEVVLIGQVVLNPMIDEDGDLTKKSKDDMQTVYLTFTSKNGEKTEKGTMEFDEVETNRFFALPIEVQNDWVLSDLHFVISRKKWYSNTEHVYRTTLAKIKFPLNQKLVAGEVYSIGTIKIDLDQKSFKEIGDEEYDDEEVHYIVPKSITLNANHTAAKEWFKKDFPKAGKAVKEATASVKVTDSKNEFKETQITTTYR